MDPTEDLSARVLLGHILSTEPPKTPITRSASNAQTTSSTRSSKRLSRKNAGAQTPQDILRRSLGQKLRESITRKSLPAAKKRTSSVMLRKTNAPAPTSVLFDDGDTPRQILKNILRTEPVKSPVVHENVASEEPRPSSADSNKRPSMELSGLDLPDITIGNAASTAKGLSRKRPRRSLNVTAFEKRLKDGEDVEDENEESMRDHSSLSLSRSNLSLKTPFVDVQTEKRGLQKKVSNRRKISVEEFGAAVIKRQMGGVSSFVQVEQGLSETGYSEGFSLGLSKLGEPDITTDILHCNTALYAQPDAMTSGFSMIATQDQQTVMASQLQRQMEQQQQEKLMEAEHSQLGKDKSMYVFPNEDGTEPQNEEYLSQVEDDANTAESQKEEEESSAGDSKVMSETEEEQDIAESQSNAEDNTAKSENEDDRAEAQTAAGDCHTEEEVATCSQSEEEEAAAGSQTEEEGAGYPQTEEEQGAVDSPHEEDFEARSQSEVENVAPDSQMEEEEEEEDAVHYQIEEDGFIDLQSVEVVVEYQSDSEDPAANSQPEDEYDERMGEEDVEVSEHLEPDLEHISRRLCHSKGELITAATVAGEELAEAGLPDGKPEGHSSLEMGVHESDLLQIGITDAAESSAQRQTDASDAEAESDADEGDSFTPPEVARDIEDGGHRSVDAPEEAAEQVEECEEDEDSDEIPSKTPAFVRQKIKFAQPNPLASPSVLKNVQSGSPGEGLPAPKQKQVRKKRTGPAKKKTDLPKSYLMSVFRHFAKTKVSEDVYPVLNEIMDKYFDRVAEDLETYAVHAKRKTIEVEDVELLLKRQGYVNDKVPVEVLIEKYLRMDQRKLLIPIATSGNVVFPKKR
ncbi:Golgi integral membrane protein 4 isoform X2 [Clinocottus analis]|uniref:Golgi integral membrane protein 4 isoform X2 n=1 Tax=Clinocottus analis TaxID=304258 RepID=UPI0035BF3990